MYRRLGRGCVDGLATGLVLRLLLAVEKAMTRGLGRGCQEGGSVVLCGPFWFIGRARVEVGLRCCEEMNFSKTTESEIRRK